MEKLAVAIVGLGRIGQLHASNILAMDEFELVACVDPVIEEFKGLYVYREFDDLLAKEKIHAVLICSPSNLHTQQVIQALNNDLHVFCEKPIGLSEPDILDTISLTESCEHVLQVGFNRRFDLHFSELKRQMNTIKDYKPQLIKITSRDPYPPSQEYLASSGGIFFDMMIHDFDMLRFLSNEEVVEVYAQGWDLNESLYQNSNDYAIALVQCKLQSGAMAIIENCRHSNYGYDQRIEVFSEQTSFNVANVKESLVSRQMSCGLVHANPQEFFLSRYAHAFKQQLSAFHDAIINKGNASVSAIDGLRAFKIAQAAQASAQQRQVVSIGD